MKTIIIVYLFLIALCLPADAHAQTWNEWFKQKKTQKKYLAEQIAALKVYTDNLTKGIDIAHKGLNTIHNIKNGNFNLHRDFFSSLKNVNPHISNLARVADIIAFQIYINRDLKRLVEFCKHNDQYTADEVRYVLRVYTNMLFLCDANISELLTLIRSDESSMSDDERIQRVDQLYGDMQDKYAFVQDFANDARALGLNRARDQHAIMITTKNAF